MQQFKVGDWVKCIDGSIQRIAEIDEKSEEIYYIDSDNELICRKMLCITT